MIKFIKTKSFLFLAVFIAFCCYLGISKYNFFYIQYLGWDDSSLKSVSQKNEINAEDFINKTNIIDLGEFTFLSPWGEVADIKNVGSGKVVYFEKGAYLFLYGKRSILNKTPATINNIKTTQYDLFSSVINSTPYDITLLSPNSLGDRLLGMLMAKKLLTLSENLIYNFELINVKGFQVGDPQKDKRIILYLFPGNEIFYEIYCGITKTSKFLLNQNDLNTVIASFNCNAKSSARSLSD